MEQLQRKSSSSSEETLKKILMLQNLLPGCAWGRSQLFLKLTREKAPKSRQDPSGLAVDLHDELFSQRHCVWKWRPPHGVKMDGLPWMVLQREKAMRPMQCTGFSLPFKYTDTHRDVCLCMRAHTCVHTHTNTHLDAQK